MTLQSQINSMFAKPRRSKSAPKRYFATVGCEFHEIRNRNGVWYADLPSGQLSSVLFNELKRQVREAGYAVIPQVAL